MLTVTPAPNPSPARSPVAGGLVAASCRTAAACGLRRVVYASVEGARVRVEGRRRQSDPADPAPLSAAIDSAALSAGRAGRLHEEDEEQGGGRGRSCQ